METTVYNQKGEAIGKIDLPNDIFEVKINPDLVYQVMTIMTANQRQGTADTKTRGEVAGGGKKPWRQKGTGRARHGSIRSPIWRHGGTVFGPQKEKVYGGKINKKARRLALKMALSSKTEGNLLVVDTIEFSQPKTKIAAETIANLKNHFKNYNKGKILVALPQYDKETIRAMRNLADVNTIEAQKLNLLDILNNKYLILPQKSVAVIVKILSNADQNKKHLVKR